MAMAKPAEAKEMRLVMTKGVRNAQLPANYIAAKNAVAALVKVDECQGWAKKAAAMASYARQSEDTALEEMAMKIRARAIRRCGQLMSEIPPSPGGRPGRSGEHRYSWRDKAAREAGISAGAQRTAIRVASIPGSIFDSVIENGRPATITKLEEMGTKKKPRVVQGSLATKIVKAALRRRLEIEPDAEQGSIFPGAKRLKRVYTVSEGDDGEPTIVPLQDMTDEQIIGKENELHRFGLGALAHEEELRKYRKQRKKMRAAG